MGQDRKPPKGAPDLRKKAGASRQDELRRGQIALEAADNRYRDFYDFAPVGFLTLNESGLIREVNLTAAGQFGVTRGYLIDKPFQFFIEGEDRERFRLGLRRVFQEPGPQRCEITLQRPDGGNFFARLDSVAVQDTGGESVCRTSITDLSELKQAEQKLQDSERLFAAFMGHLPGVAAIRDLEGRYLFANSAWEQAFQKSRDEWRGKTTDDLWPAEVAAKFKAQDRRVIETGVALQSLVTLRHAGGLHHWIYYRFPIVDPDGHTVMIGVNAIDVPEPLETKARLEHLLASGPAAIYTFEAEGNFAPTYISENVKGLVGWEPRQFLENPRFWIKHVHPEDRRRVLKRMELPWPEDHQTFEYRFLAQDGAYRWMHDELKLVRDANGQPVEMAGAWMDITAHRQAEEALRESEEKYHNAYELIRLLIDTAPDLIWAKDMNDRFMLVNQAMCRKLLMCDHPQEAVGKTDMFYAERERKQGHEFDFGELCTNSDALVKESKTPCRFLESGTVRGHYLALDVQKAPFINEQGEMIGTVGYGRDITKEKEIEEALKESESHYRLLVKQIPAVVFKGYQDWSIDFFDDKIEEVTGYRKEEFNSRRLRWCDLILPEDLDMARGLFVQALKTDKSYVREYRIRKKDGEIAWIQARGQIFGDAAGQVDYVSGVFFDISERKALEAQLLQAQKMEAVGRLAGGVAHDFNNLLMVVMGYGELIRSSLVKDDPLYKYSEDILKASERAASLTQQLLAFSRRQVMQPQVINLNRVAADLEKMLGRLIGEHIDLDIVAGPDLGAVKADPGQIGHIIMNLAVNARDAMPTGGRLTLEMGNIEFAASHNCHSETAPPGRYVRLAVSDTGSGMEAETLDHIFEPFFTTKEVGKGTGLGLPMVYGIVKQNRGYLEVESRPGQGATFQIYLPRLEAAVEEPRTRITLAAKLEGSETILVVEDEDALRTLLCRFFRLYGYNVLEARHGGEALLICERRQGPIHLMVTDVVMPQMSGRELADRLAPLHPEMRVIFMSGYTGRDLTGYGAPESSQHFISKPFRPMDLVKKVRDFLDVSRGSTAESPPP